MHNWNDNSEHCAYIITLDGGASLERAIESHGLGPKWNEKKLKEEEKKQFSPIYSSKHIKKLGTTDRLTFERLEGNMVKLIHPLNNQVCIIFLF